MKRKFLSVVTAATLALIMGLSGCTKQPAGETTASPTPAASEAATTAEASATPAPAATDNSAAANEVASTFPEAIENNEPSIEGGVLRYGLTLDTGFQGILNPAFYEDSADAEILTFFVDAVVSFDENFVMDQDGACTYEFDVDKKTITFKMREGIKWHDGEPVTLDDLVYAYEVIAHKDYNGFRYDESFENIVGVNEYRAGTADKISGLELSDDKMTLTISFVDFYPSLLVSGFWTYAIPRHYYGDIAVKDMSGHDKTRFNPIGFGPFKVKNVVPGESVEFVRFDDYWMGKPKLDGVVLEVVSTDLVPTAMKEGKYDIATFSTAVYPDYKNPTNYTYLGELMTVFDYTGFKLGTIDLDNSVNVTDPNSKMYNVKLRQAIGYAIDNETIAQDLFNGLRFLATTVITPRHGSYQNKDLAGYYYDPELSKKLLDEAGYVDVDGDGFREDPDGNQFTIHWAARAGSSVADTLAQFKLQNWADVGLRVELATGRLIEVNAFYEMVEKDDPQIDMYDAGWQTGYDPNPASLWGRKSPTNYTRYTSDKFDEIIGNISSQSGWDNDYLQQQYKDWQVAFFEEAPAIPTLWRIGLEAVNKRVKNYNLTEPDITQNLHNLELTASEPYKE